MTASSRVPSDPEAEERRRREVRRADTLSNLDTSFIPCSAYDEEEEEEDEAAPSTSHNLHVTTSALASESVPSIEFDQSRHEAIAQEAGLQLTQPPGEELDAPNPLFKAVADMILLRIVGG